MSAISLEIISRSEDETHALAASLARLCKVGDCLLLSGEVGAGKTSFARAFIQAISPVQTDITSPTFTLVQTYPLHDGGTLTHCDLYRVKHAEELQELGLDEAFAQGITLIEWPDIARADVPSTALSIHIETEKDYRRFVFHGAMNHWQQRLAGLQS